MYDKYEKNESEILGIRDLPFVLPTEPEVSFPLICVLPFFHFPRVIKAGKVLYKNSSRFRYTLSMK